jgi:hypothetical protein
MAASFWGVMARLLGTSVNVLPQALQRHRSVPERLVPKRMTFSRLRQWEHAKAIMPALYPVSYPHGQRAQIQCLRPL